MNEKAIQEAGKMLASAGASHADAQDKKVSYGGYDLTDYSKDMEKMGLAITSVRGSLIKDEGGERNVLLVTSFNAEKGVTVTDYLVQGAAEGKKLDSTDLVHRDVSTKNGMRLYGGKDKNDLFTLNVESKAVQGRNVWGVSLDGINSMTDAVIKDPDGFKRDAEPGIAAGKQDYPQPANVPDLGPEKKYFYAPERLQALSKDKDSDETKAVSTIKKNTGGVIMDVTPDMQQQIVSNRSFSGAGQETGQAGRVV